MVEMFYSFLFLPCPNRCVFILLPHWTRKATLYLTDQSADAIYSSMPKTPLPAPEPVLRSCWAMLLLRYQEGPHKGISPTEKNQREDSACDLFFHSPAISGVEAEISTDFLEDLTLCA